MSTFRGFLLAGVLGLVSLPAMAGEARSLKVAAADLDLSGEAGRAVLADRIRGAVREVCTVSDWGAGLDAERQMQVCSQKAFAAATPQVEALVKASQAGRVARAGITVVPR
jgi:UrcA family protein